MSDYQHSMHPLDQEERDEIIDRTSVYSETVARRWEATVRAVESERDAANARAEKLREALEGVVRGYPGGASYFAMQALRSDDAARGVG